MQKTNFKIKTKRQQLWDDIKKNKVFYSMMMPFLIVFFTFTVIPVLMSFVISFTSYDILQAPKFAGLDNYIYLFLKDDVFLIALRNTIILALVTGPISYIMAFIFAWLINELPKKLKWFLTLVFYAPSISGSAFMLWTLIFSGDMHGYLNALLINWGVIDTPILWLKTPQYALIILIIVQLWLSLGISFLAFIAGLQGTDRSLYEAAAIDGIKNRWQELWYVTLPQMKSQLMFGAVMQITTSLSISGVSTSLLGFPSVEYSGHTIVTHLIDYGAGSIRLELGYACSIAMVLFVIMMVANLVVQSLIRRVGK